MLGGPSRDILIMPIRRSGESTPHRWRSRCLPFQPLLDFQHVVGTELDVGSTGNTACLLGAADSDDGTRHGGISQGPPDGHLGRCCVVTLADITQSFDQAKTAGQPPLLEVRAV